MAAHRNKLSSYFQIFVFFIIIYNFSGLQRPQKVPLVIGIFSAPQNFEQRNAIRNTWLKLGDESTMKYNFIVGNNMCLIHPQDRLEPYGCEKRDLQDHLKILTSLPETLKIGRRGSVQGVQFIANHRMQVTHLGLPACYQQDGSTIVELRDGFDGTVLAKATFSEKGSEIQEITPVLFPRYSEGIIVTVNNKNQQRDTSCCPSITNRTQGGITFSRFLKDGHIVPATDSESVCPFIRYSILEDYSVDELKSRSRSWENTIQNTYRSLNDEIKKFQDIALVEVTDVYENLPVKLIKFLKYTNDIEFDYLMKTDDDSFIDLPRVQSELKNPQILTSQMWWWSSFKEFWHVPQEGKWREDNYLSATYPPFPCGGGYIINKATASYLATNNEKLKLFQGEDVSIGIWLSAVDIKKDSRTEPTNPSITYKSVMLGVCEDRCVWTCSSSKKAQLQPRCNLVQQSIPEMYHTWNDFKRTGFL